MDIRVPFYPGFGEALKKSADKCVAACLTAAFAYRNEEDQEACRTTTLIEPYRPNHRKVSPSTQSENS